MSGDGCAVDVVYWMLDVQGPTRVYSTGGPLFLQRLSGSI